MPSHHLLSKELDSRLVKYASNSWNAYEATFSIQQLIWLLPVYSQSLIDTQGARGLSAARRAWGVAADLVSAVTGMTPSYATLTDLGFFGVIDVGRITTYNGTFALADSTILRTPFETLGSDDVLWLLDASLGHDRVAKPLLESLQDELRAWDAEARSAFNGDDACRPQTLRDLVRALDDEPTHFPDWDGRPLFLDEQRALLEYLARNAAAEIVADRLIDEPLGRYILLAAGVLRHSETAGEAVLDIDAVPFDTLVKPVNLVCHQIGDAVLAVLSALESTIDPLDQLVAIETVVRDEFAIDVRRAFEHTRLTLIEARLEYLSGDLLDLTEKKVRPLSTHLSRDVEPFQFPELRSEA